MTSTTPETQQAAPVCEECGTAREAVGRAPHRYWSCRWCGSVLPR